MQRGTLSTAALKVVLGSVLIGAGAYLAFRAPTNVKLATDSKGYAVSIAHAQQGGGNQSSYCANWKATKLLGVYTQTLPIKYQDNSSRKWIAIGPAQWEVTYTDGAPDGSGNCVGTTLATETWKIPDFLTSQGQSCYVASAACKPGGAHEGTYLWGIANTSSSSNTFTAYKNMSFGIFNTTDNTIFYDESNNNQRFSGSGAAGQTNNNTNTEGFYSPGAYGWFGGALGADGTQDYTEAAGIMMPLKWTVSGTLYAQ